MSHSATAAEDLRRNRVALGVSQSRLARLSGVRRFKICTFELGSGSLSKDEHERIGKALRAEVHRLRDIFTQIDLGQLAPQAECVAPNQVRDSGPRSSHER